MSDDRPLAGGGFYKVVILDRASGAQRIWRSDGPWETDGGWNTGCLWVLGNRACDCVRARFFAEAGGERYDDRVPCGTDRFECMALLADGRQIDLEDENAACP